MITAQDLHNVSLGGLTIMEKRIVFELSTIESLAKTKAACKETFLIYTLYKGTLVTEEFRIMRSRVITELKKNGFTVARRGNIEEENEYMILKIIWG